MGCRELKVSNSSPYVENFRHPTVSSSRKLNFDCHGDLKFSAGMPRVTGGAELLKISAKQLSGWFLRGAEGGEVFFVDNLSDNSLLVSNV
jgi:hypothetical protein